MPPRDRPLLRSAGAAAIAALVVAASGFSLGSATVPDPGGRAEVQVNLCDPPEQIVRALSLTPRFRAELLAQLADAGVTLCPDQSSQSAAKLRALSGRAPTRVP